MELTGTLAGLSFAFQNNRLIALSGLITGIAASMSTKLKNLMSQLNCLKVISKGRIVSCCSVTVWASLFGSAAICFAASVILSDIGAVCSTTSCVFSVSLFVAIATGDLPLGVSSVLTKPVFTSQKDTCSSKRHRITIINRKFFSKRGAYMF